jgi:integrase
LYLVFDYGKDQKRDYEFLKLHLYEKPKNNIEKEHNKETLQLAEAIKAKRILDVQSTSHGFVSNVKCKIGFLAYFKSLVDKKFDSRGNHDNWLSTYRHLYDFMKGNDVPLERVDERFLESLKEYLLSCKTRKTNRETILNQNTVLSYYNKIRAALREAYNNKMIKDNPATRVKSVKLIDSHREFLAFEELQQLAATECEIPILKKAFLFSALTGLRWSDVKALSWENINFSENDGRYLKYTQKKTKGAEILPIPEQAIRLLGDRDEFGDTISQSLGYSGKDQDKVHKDKPIKAIIHFIKCRESDMGSKVKPFFTH